MNAKSEPLVHPYEEWLDTLDPYTLNPIRHKGMTLRDYFAAKAMAALICETLIEGNKRIELSFDNVVKKTANASYDIADAMIKAREVAQ